MKKRAQLFFSILSLFSMLLFPLQAFAQVPRITTLPVTPVTMNAVSQGPHFVQGKDLTVSENFIGDTYVFGSNVLMEGNVDGDLLIAGGNVTINGNVTQNIRAAGGEVIINGTVGKNVTIAGGQVTFGPGSMVKGNVVSAGGMVSVNGAVSGPVWIAASKSDISGKIGSDVNDFSGNFTVLPNAVINGKVMAKVSKTSDISDQAQITGGKDVQFTPMTRKTASASEDSQNRKGLVGLILTLVVVKFIVSIVVGLISGWVLLTLFPVQARQMSETLSASPLGHFGWGFVYTIVAPILGFLLIFTIVAWPLGVLTLIFFLAAAIVSSWITAHAIGKYLARKCNVSFLSNPYAQFAAGFVLLEVIEVIPLVGGLTKLVTVFMGMGAFFLMFKNSFSKSTPAKIKRK